MNGLCAILADCHVVFEFFLYLILDVSVIEVEGGASTVAISVS